MAGGPADRRHTAETYLHARGIVRHIPAARCRFHPAAVDGKPALLVPVARDGKLVAVQRVALLADGSDRDREAGKKSLGPISAGFFVLADPAPEFTVIVEGPEDALSVWFAAHEEYAAPDIRVVAMLGQRWATAAETFPGATFFADADSLGRAREAAFACGGKLVDPRPAKDANEILLAEGAHALWDRVTAAETVEPEPAGPAFVCIADLADKPIPARAWHVEDLVPARTVTTISGDGGVGKVLLALQLAISTALGLPWAGRPVAAAPVIFVTAEDELDEVRRRVGNICELIDRSPSELFRLDVLSLAGWDAICAAWDRKTNTMAPTELYADIEAKLRDTGARLAIFDTLADLHSGQENDRAHARQVISQFRGLALRHDCAVVLLAHPSLTGLATGTGASGSTAWNNSVRSRLYLERVFVEGEEADPDLRKLTTKKSNYGPTGAEVLLRWTAGAFEVLTAETGLDKAAAEARAERVFWNCCASARRNSGPCHIFQAPIMHPHNSPRTLPPRVCPGSNSAAAMDRLFAA